MLKFLLTLGMAQAHAGLWQRFCENSLQNPQEYDEVSTQYLATLAFRYQMRDRWGKSFTKFERSDYALLRSQLRLHLMFGTPEMKAEAQGYLDDGLVF